MNSDHAAESGNWPERHWRRLVIIVLCLALMPILWWLLDSRSKDAPQAQVARRETSAVAVPPGLEIPISKPAASQITAEGKPATKLAGPAFIMGRIGARMADVVKLTDEQTVELERFWQASIKQLQVLERRHAKIVTQPDGGQVVRIEEFWDQEGAVAYQSVCDGIRSIIGADKAALLIPAIRMSGADTGGFGCCPREVYVNEVVAGDDGRVSTRLLMKVVDPLASYEAALRDAKVPAERAVAQQELEKARQRLEVRGPIPVDPGPSFTLSTDNPWLRGRYGFLLSEEAAQAQ